MNVGHDPSPVDRIQIAKNCPVSWRSMKGDFRVRYCPTCNQNVYNVLGMSAKEAEELIRSNRGRLCMRLYLRPDGTVITKDCSLREKAKWRVLGVIAPALAFLGFTILSANAISGDISTPAGRFHTYIYRKKAVLKELKQTKDAAKRKKLEAQLEEMTLRYKEMETRLKDVGSCQ